MNRVELLAPAGNYESFLGAIHAGADAVYLGGDKFGARAYADNFHTEQLCQAISYAHLFGRRVYLTLNTLIKEKEFGELYDYLAPFYEAGLDGVIVQDLGVFAFIKRNFPLLPLHVSTQMTITGVHGADMLRQEGAVRIVPARELSLNEIKTIKQQTGLELETFIHGAMCYCYSGQCLFSSILGGRSGNRGKCAQPCRLPFEVCENGRTVVNGISHPLSLKDLCTIEHLPALIEAGIDSFKIEGRMKKPEYAAGVTAIYRKYIDLYYKKGRDGYRVSEEDLRLLEALYIRSEIQDGYYFRHNGKEMITHGAPGYSGSDEAILQQVRRKYLENNPKLPVCMEAGFHVDQPAWLRLSIGEEPGGISVTVTGDTVQRALKQPVSQENIRDGLSAVGGTVYRLEQLNIDAEKDIFYSLKAIKQLRREGLEKLSGALEVSYFPELAKRRDTLSGPAKEIEVSGSAAEPFTDSHRHTEEFMYAEKKGNDTRNQFRVLFTRKEQFHAFLDTGIQASRIYLDCDMCSMEEWQTIFDQLKNMQAKTSGAEVYLVLPYILRAGDDRFLQKLYSILQLADGCMVRNMEGYAFLREKDYPKPVCADAGLYLWNREAAQFWQNKLDGFCVPYELSGREQEAVCGQIQSGAAWSSECEASDCPRPVWEQVVYGYLPMMVTANCVAKTSGKCLLGRGGKNIHQPEDNGKTDGRGQMDGSMVFSLRDRYRKNFPVYTNCAHCYNVIYNSVPLSLHEKVREGQGQLNMRLDFTVECAGEVRDTVRFFKALKEGQSGLKLPYEQYTTGHEKRGAE